MKKTTLLAACILLFSLTANAQTNTCEQLEGDKKTLAKKIMDSQHPYSCCDDTISNCLQKKSPCKLVNRLAENICYRVKRGESEKKIVLRLTRRAQSMNPYASKSKINNNGYPAAGNHKAPVSLTIYACARCPFCSKLVPQVYTAVTTGVLKDKVKLYFKPFPLKSHEYSKEGGLAMVAALHMGKFWDYLLRLYSNFDMFCIDKLDDWAKVEGLDPQKFTKMMKDPIIRKQLIECKKEGLANKVNATPALFINKRKYTGFLDMKEVIDVLEEEYERTKK